jgi:hypothetical protein
METGWPTMPPLAKVAYTFASSIGVITSDPSASDSPTSGSIGDVTPTRVAKARA